MLTQKVGRWGEDEAEKYLKNLGYKILEHNYHSRFGEIDLIALDNKVIVFVEVKARSTPFFGLGAEAVGKQKISRMVKTAMFYLSETKKENDEYRLDVVELTLTPAGLSIHHDKSVTS